MPRVSVLTPIYNTNPAHLREMIESILNQTFSDFEFLILNDSPENKEIEKIVKSYPDARIKYIKNAKNMGISASRNKLLDMSRGEYIAIFDHDDISVPTRLEQQVAFLDKNPHIGVVSGWLEKFGDTKNNGEIWRQPEHDSDIRIALMADCHVMHTAAMIRKSVLTDNDIKYEEFFTPAEDYRLWARLLDVTRFYNLPQVLVKYRWFDNNTSKRMDAARIEAAQNIRLELCSKYPVYYDAMLKTGAYGTRFRLRLLGLPLLKIKNNTVYLFEFIPVFKIKWS